MKTLKIELSDWREWVLMALLLGAFACFIFHTGQCWEREAPFAGKNNPEYLSLYSR
jgi:hypothetical protein